MPRAPVAWLSIAVCVLGCGGQDLQARVNTLVARGAYAEAVTATRREPALEKTLASAVLKQGARSNDAERRRRAFAELQLAGTHGRPVLEDLTRSSEPVTRAMAYSALWSLGDSGARDALAPLASDADPELAALGYSALDAEADRPLLMAALTEPNHARRLSAVRVLGAAQATPEVQAALEGVAKHDPETDVRAAAVAALGRYGEAAQPALERALDDRAEPVRISAVAALTRLGSEPALTRLARDLGAAPTPETLTAAASLLRLTPPRESERALVVLERALGAADVGLRAQAAVLCRTLREPRCSGSALRDRLRQEPRAEIKLLVALAIGPDDPLARSALGALAQSASPVAVEADAELAQRGDAAARQRLVRALGASEARVRIGAVRALGRIGALDAAVADRLGDSDERVRTAAAAAVLRAG